MFKKDRMDWLDVARGWAMVLVIFAHTAIPLKLSAYIYSFHVPLFFIISGFLLPRALKKSPSEFIKNKVLRLAVPYFFFSLVAYAYWLIVRHMGWDHAALGVGAEIPLNGTLTAIRDSVSMTHNSALWFICSLFVSEIAFYFIHRFTKGDRVLLIAAIGASLVGGAVYDSVSGAALPWALDTVPFVLVFLCFGYYASNYYPKWKKLRYKRPHVGWLVMCGLLIVSIATSLLNKTVFGRVDMYYGMYGNYALYFAAAISGSLAVLVLFEAFSLRVKTLGRIGTNSLIVYALHQKVIFGLIGAIFMTALGRVYPFYTYSSIEKMLNGIVYVVLTLLISVPVTLLLTRYCAPFIGRGRKKEKLPESVS